MSPQQYFDTYQGQSLLYAPSAARESLRGQCVQSVCFYVAANGKPVIWADAHDWWDKRMFQDQYDYIENTATAVPQPGDIIIWGSALPGSLGGGHIAVCLLPLPGTGTFISVDQNWGGKTVHKVTHNYSYVVGWLRMKGVVFGGMGGGSATTTPAQGGVEMIENENQARQAYGMLRPNGTPSADEISSTAGKRTWAQFANDAQGEVNQRNANLAAQAQQLVNASAQINTQNQAITDLTTKLHDSDATAQEKQAALKEALTTITSTNNELATAHDQIKELQTAVQTGPQPAAPAAEPKKNLLTVIILAFMKLKKK